MAVLRAVIFDFDGVLVDSERAHFEGFRTVLADGVGFEITFTEYAEHYMVHDDHGVVRHALERHGTAASPALVDRLATRKKEVFAGLFPSIGFLPGARALIGLLNEAGVPLAIASGSPRNEIESLLHREGLLGMFRGIVSVNDVSHMKPHPESFVKARGLVDAVHSAQGVLAFEDSIHGIASARAADLRVVGVTNSHPREQLVEAHHVVDSLTALTLADLAAVVEAV
jgi:beta-phosphoglucomutase-like phosphatase (HAD superfamily)